MSKLDTFIQERQQRSEEWKAQKTAERDELNALSESGILTATMEPQAYLRYLDVQADNPRYSASNILLAMEQNPEITFINSLKNWNDLGRSIKQEETGMKVRVTDPYIKDGREHRGYKVGRVFDIAQTTGKGTVPKLTLQENTPEMDAALRKLLDQSPVKVNTSTTTYHDALYDPASQEITVSTNLTDGQTFAALAREIVHAKLHDHGRYPTIPAVTVRWKPTAWAICCAAALVSPESSRTPARSAHSLRGWSPRTGAAFWTACSRSFSGCSERSSGRSSPRSGGRNRPGLPDNRRNG